MAKFISRRAVAVTFGVLALTLAGGGIAAAQTTAVKPAAQTEQPGARAVVQSGQPVPTAAEAAQAKAALKAKKDVSPSFVAGSTSFAVVSSAGVLLRGHDVVSVTKYGPGQYQVIFNRSLLRGGYVATIGTTTDCCLPPAGEVSAAPRLATPNGIFVQTHSSAGVAADRPFHLAVFTP